MALHTGCRKNELLKLEWSRVDFERRVFVLEAKHTKAHRRRVVPLNDEAIAVLKTQLEWVERYAGGARWVVCSAFRVPANNDSERISRCLWTRGDS
ncbi:tyrosine-type recombinase/integrase [Paraburkholderia megapolitana]|uniref:tyrosine-type recombinase/integrase n=1 Tax=Paraburkholderia megapolitana TaxID=420953 RepID=UPI0038BBFF2D